MSNLNAALERLIVPVIIGLLLGVATSFGQTYIPDPLKQFANSYSVWLLVSFVFGVFAVTKHYRQTLLGGATIQVMALISYYIASTIRFSSGVGTASMLLFWFAGGVIAGPLLALGANIGNESKKISLIATLAMLFIILSEATYLFVFLHHVDKGVCFVVLAVIFAFFAAFNYSNQKQASGAAAASKP